MAQLEPQAPLQHRQDDVDPARVYPLSHPFRRGIGAARGQCLDLQGNRSLAVNRQSHRRAGHPRRPLRQERLGWVRYSHQPLVFHPKDPHLAYCPEAVLGRTQYAIHAGRFQVEGGVHHVLDDLGPGHGALLGNVAHQHQRGAGRLGPAHQRLGGVAHRHQRTGNALRLDGLYRVHNHQLRRRLLEARQHGLQPGLANQLQTALHPQPLRPQLDLPGRLLAGDVDHALTGAQHGVCNL